MRALMLAAGRGRRMKGLTDDRPKALLPVGGRPLVAWARAAFAESGIDTMGLVAGYRAERLASLGFAPVFVNPAWEATNSAYSLFRAAQWMREGSTIICYSDILFTPATIELLASADHDIVVCNNVNWRAVWERRFADPLDDAETFKRRPDGQLTEIGRKPTTLADIEGQYMGLIKVTAHGWRAWESLAHALGEDRMRTIDMTSFLNELIGAGVVVQTVDTQEAWFEFDSGEDLEVYG